MDIMDSIRVQRLRKGYGRGLPPAVDITEGFSVSRGELFGIIGPDGAGKTTLFRLLTTLIAPDEGDATVQGLDIMKDYRKLRTIIGYMPGRFSLYPDLSVKENLDFFASVFGTSIEENYHLIEDIYCRLEPFADRKAGNIVVSTAYMDEANRCDRVAMMKAGRFLKLDSPRNIVDGFDRRLIAVRSDDMFRLLQDLRSMEDVDRCYTFGDTHHIVLNEGSVCTPEDISVILSGKYGHTGVEAAAQAATLEDCYMNLDG